MKRILFYTTLVLLTTISCTKFENEIPTPAINLGVKSTSTAVKSIKQEGSTVTAVFLTTPGAKYSLQVVPFGSEDPAKKEGFTASSEETVKVLNLSDLPKNYYTLLFIDVDGKEVKYPIIIN